MEINTKFNLGSIIKLNKEKAINQLAECCKKDMANLKDDFYGEIYLKDINKFSDKKFIVVKIKTQIRPQLDSSYNAGNVEIEYEFSEYSDLIDANKSLTDLYNRKTKFKLTNKKNVNSMDFKLVEDFFEEVK